MIRFIIRLFLVSIFFLSMIAVSKNEEKIVKSTLLSSVDKLSTKKPNRIAIQLEIHEDWHINANDPGDEYLFPSEITFDSTHHIRVGEIEYPLAEEVNFSFAENPIFVYEGLIYAYSTITASPEQAGKTITLSGKVTYQACNDAICLAPQSAEFSLEIAVASNNEAANLINKSIFINQ